MLDEKMTEECKEGISNFEALILCEFHKMFKDELLQPFNTEFNIKNEINCGVLTISLNFYWVETPNKPNLSTSKKTLDIKHKTETFYENTKKVLQVFLELNSCPKEIWSLKDKFSYEKAAYKMVFSCVLNLEPMKEALLNNSEKCKKQREENRAFFERKN